MPGDFHKVRVNRGRLAQAEHDEQLRKFLRKNLDSLIRKQKLVVDGRIKTNLTTLELPTLEFGRPEKESLGQGQPGQGKKGQGDPDGEPAEPLDLSGRQGSDDHGVTGTVEIDFEEFVRLAQEQLMEELDLPPVGPPRMEGEVASFSEESQMELDRHGLPADLDLERTMVESLQRSIRETGEATYDVDVRRDGWYGVDEPEESQCNRALEVYLLDISGSVSGNNIALIRKFIFILWYYLDRRYRTNERRFVVFQDEAEELTREQFFSIESKGGTHISAGMKIALDCLTGYEQYDKYLFFFSDGDNSSSDDEAARDLLDQTLERFDLLCYGRINPCDSPLSPFTKRVREILKEEEGNLTFTDIKDLENVQNSIKLFLNLLDGKSLAS
jgi:uncharacterized sporulation protein YeaH/YhbH (DUF444 family)